MTRAVPLLTLCVLALCAGSGVAGAGHAVRAAIFYYPWYGNPAHDGAWVHWAQNGHRPPYDLASDFYPLRGAYSSSDRAVLDAQMAEIAAAGVDEVVSSWWGRGSPEDANLRGVLAAARAHRLQVAVHVEPYPGRTAATVEADIAYLRPLGISEFYVYRPDTVPDADWASLNARLSGVRLLAQTSLPGRAAAGGFAGLYTYDVLAFGGSSFARICAGARRLGLLCEPSVGPGYDARRATGDERVELRRDGATYDGMWRAAIHSGADAVTITSYNEWHEGTQIEPASSAAPARRGFSYETYDGAWGRHGAAAAHAYLDRTAFWTAQYRMAASLRR